MNNNNNDDRLNKLFNLCWSNIYIRSIIFNHLRIYNLVYEYTKHNTLCFKTLKLFKYKHYIKELNFHSESFDYNFEVDEIDEELFYSDLNLISNGGKEEDYKLPYGIESLIIHSNFNFNSSSIPRSVTSLCFTSSFDQELPYDVIPNSVCKLSIESNGYSRQIKPGVIPNSVQSLLFCSNTFLNDENISQVEYEQDKSSSNGESFNSSGNQVLVEGSIPSSVTYLDMGNFNQDITANLLPDSILEITFYSFNSIIQKLPSNLKSITFNREFNQDLLYNDVPILPSTLEILNLSSDFNKEIINSNTLPPNLKSINFGDSFDQQINKDILPASLESITFGYFFRHSIEQINFKSLPNLKYLEFYSTEYHIKFQPELIKELSSIIYNKSENEKQTIYFGI